MGFAEVVKTNGKSFQRDLITFYFLKQLNITNNVFEIWRGIKENEAQ